MIAKTEDHKLGDLTKIEPLIVLEASGPAPSGGSRGGKSFLPLPAFGSCQHTLASLAGGHITLFAASDVTLPSHLLQVTLLLFLSYGNTEYV